MTKVQVWLLNEKIGWFGYLPTFEVPAPPEDALRAAREQMRVRLPKLKERIGFRPPAVAYEVLPDADG